MAQMQVEWKGQNLILKFILCEFTIGMQKEQPVALIMIEKVWQDFI